MTMKKGDVVKLNVATPNGPIVAMRMTEDGAVQCLVEWTDDNGIQQRWFDEAQLVAV